jgi:outer membrane protein assembly factor BamB
MKIREWTDWLMNGRMRIIHIFDAINYISMPLKFVKPFCWLIIVMTSISSCTTEDEPKPPTDKDITAFILKNADQLPFDPADVSVSIGKDSIEVVLPAGTDLTRLIPDIRITGVSVSPASGVPQDFSNGIRYTVTAGDSSTHVYTVLVKRRKAVYMGTSAAFYALDEANGRQVWKFTDGRSFAYSDPVLYKGIVYAGGISGYMYAFNANTGAVIWKTKLGSTGIECGPAVAGNTVYVGDNDDYFYALDATTGAEKWRFSTLSNNSSNPVLFGNTVIFGSSDSRLIALDTATGSLVWQYNTGDAINSSAPALSNGVVFVGSRDGYLYAINAATGQLKWRYSTINISLEASSPAVYNGIVYIGGWYDTDIPDVSIGGSLYAVNEQTGQLVWHALDSLGFSTSPCVNDGKVYISADDGSLYAVHAATGIVLWDKKILPNSASAAISGNTLYVGGSGTWYIYALDKNTGAEKWKFRLQDNEYQGSTPVIGRKAKPTRLFSVGR